MGMTAAKTGRLNGAGTGRERRKQLLLLGGLLLLALVYPFLDEALRLQQYTLGMSTLIPIFFFIILALGLNIVVGFAGLLDLGYAAFYVIGAYTTALLTSPQSPLYEALRDTPFVHFWPAMIISVIPVVPEISSMRMKKIASSAVTAARIVAVVAPSSAAWKRMRKRACRISVRRPAGAGGTTSGVGVVFSSATFISLASPDASRGGQSV